MIAPVVWDAVLACRMHGDLYQQRDVKPHSPVTSAGAVKARPDSPKVTVDVNGQPCCPSCLKPLVRRLHVRRHH